VPDGAIVLFAGLGQTSRLAAQTNIAVGVGALAGSTIMLLTIPWFIGERELFERRHAMVRCVRFAPAPPFPKFD